MFCLFKAGKFLAAFNWLKFFSAAESLSSNRSAIAMILLLVFFDMLILGKWLYVANTDALLRFPYTAGQIKISAPPEKIADLPGDGRHWTKNIIANVQGTKIYIASGSFSNVGEKGMDKEINRACILEINTDGSGMRVYASGLRNPVGMFP